MKKIRKICVVTGSRAEYGLLYNLLKEFHKDKFFQLKIVATNMHLSPEFGNTYKEIEKDFKIDKKVEILLSSDSSVGISKSMGLAQISFAEVYDNLQPDMVIVLGDRYEIFSAAICAMISQIPIIHLHGGELTLGAQDDVIRHSITKMSHLHFAATNEYKKRIIQLGENPKNVFNTGALGIENIKKIKFLSKKEFEKSINFKLEKKNILVTFHPTTLETNNVIDFKELLIVLEKLKDTNIIFTKANSDVGGRKINLMIDIYVKKNSKNSKAFISLGQLKYLSALKHVDAIVGNSSSGLLEAPSFKIGTINIGNRQKGRIKAASVIDCKPKRKLLINAFNKLYSEKFQKSLRHVKNPHDNGNSSKKIVRIIKKINLDDIIKKNFFDIKF